MGERYKALSEEHIQFIAEQKIYFVATATENSRVNLSPKGSDTFRVLNANRVLWLNLTGSGNETTTHLQTHPRITIMFCSFDKKPLILRLYGQAKAIHDRDPEWPELLCHFNPLPGKRQIVDVQVELVQTSCGYAVPFFEFIAERDTLSKWAIQKGEAGIKQYWVDKNTLSIDGKATGI